MAIAVSTLTSGTSAVAGTSAATASITPTANKLVLLTVALTNDASINPTVVSITGCSLTWVLVKAVAYDVTTAVRRGMEVWRALGSAPTTEAVTITSTESERDFVWAVQEFSNVDTGGANGANAVVQAESFLRNNDLAETVPLTLGATLAAFGNAGNATYGLFSFSELVATTSCTAGIGFALSVQAEVNFTQLATEFRNDNDTSVDFTVGLAYNATDAMGVIGIEIKASPAITVQPTSQTSYTPATATFSITATGTGTVSYQWKKNGSNVGTNSNSYTTEASTNADSLSFVYCTVTDDFGNVDSSIVQWIVVGAGPGAWIRA